MPHQQGCPGCRRGHGDHRRDQSCPEGPPEAHPPLQPASHRAEGLRNATNSGMTELLVTNRETKQPLEFWTKAPF